jgi:hypothetical protein
MKNFFSRMKANLGSVAELLSYLWSRRLWWLIPMVVVLILFGVLMIFAASSGLGPFIYSIF